MNNYHYKYLKYKKKYLNLKNKQIGSNQSNSEFLNSFPDGLIELREIAEMINEYGDDRITLTNLIETNLQTNKKLIIDSIKKAIKNKNIDKIFEIIKIIGPWDIRYGLNQILNTKHFKNFFNHNISWSVPNKKCLNEIISFIDKDSVWK